MSARYAWIIDTDHLFDPDDTVTPDEKGITGPHNAPAEFLTILEGTAPSTGRMVHKFKMYDDDGELYYSGRYIGPNDDSMFGPLENFGMPNAGCTDIHYKKDGKFQGL
jgi:hypothetical protein